MLWRATPNTNNVLNSVKATAFSNLALILTPFEADFYNWVSGYKIPHRCQISGYCNAGKLNICNLCEKPILSRLSVGPLSAALLATTIVAFVLIGWQHLRARDRILGAAAAVDQVKGYQGLVLDSGGVGGFLLALIEAGDNYSVSQLELTREGRMILSRSYSDPSGRFASGWIAETAVHGLIGSDTFRANVRLPLRDLILAIIAASLTGIATGFSALALRRTHERRRQAENTKKLSLLATQVAHDIRSPLSALRVIERDLDVLPEESRVLIRSAVSRIQDIAADLLGTYQTTLKRPLPRTLAPSRVQLPVLLEQIVAEKRLQWRSKINVSIECRLGEDGYGLFASLDPVRFKRVISNLVNNAVEALHDDSGQVIVGLSNPSSDAAEISISDTGRGMAPDLLRKLGKAGQSIGKTGGHGLGLAHARAYLEEIGGNLSIESQIGVGTTLRLRLLTTPAPETFLSKLILGATKRMIVVDDDPSIHSLWRGRLARFNLETVHLSTPDQLRERIALDQSSNAHCEKPRFLIDYEFANYRESGLDLIVELGLHHDAVLVSSRIEEQKILRKCEELEIKWIPKPLAGILPIVAGNDADDGIAVSDPHPWCR